MLRIAENPQFTHQVTVLTPVDGGHRTEQFKATFKVMPVSKVKDYELETEEGTRAFLDEILLSASEIVAEDGEAPVEWSDEVRAKLCDMPHVRSALVTTYMKAVTKAQAGN